jgi:multidrug efflux system membrane fusion protein
VNTNGYPDLKPLPRLQPREHVIHVPTLPRKALMKGSIIPSTALGSAVGALTLAAAIGLSLAASGCASRAAENAGMPPPAQVSVAKVIEKQVHPWDEYTGRIAAVDSVELRPRVSGYVERVAFIEGQEVTKGQLLFIIDKRPYEAALAQAQAQLERARSDAALAQAQNVRAQALIEAKAISREDFESRRAASASGNAAVRAAEAAVAAARLNLQFTEVRSPIDGRAGRALITEGNLAQADGTLLTTVVSLGPVHVYFEADEQSYLRYQQETRDRGVANPVRVGLAGEDDYPHQGSVDFIDNQVDAGTGTIRARAVLPNPDRSLTPGLFARVQLQGSAGFEAKLVDDKAILTDQDRKYVYVVDGKHTAQRRDVRTAGIAEGLRIVTDGLQPGDQVVVEGVQKVFFPGMPVKELLVPMPATAPTGAAAPAAAVAAR